MRMNQILPYTIHFFYVHDHLTANPNKCESENVQTICHAISDFLLNAIRHDFQRRLKIARASTPKSSLRLTIKPL